MKPNVPSLTCAALALALAACTPPEGGGDAGEQASPEEEACEHLAEGPSSAVTAAADLDGAPDISEAHRRYDVTLIPVDGGNGGSVAYAAAEEGDYLIFLGADVSLSVFDSSGAEVTLEASGRGSEHCGEIAAHHTVELGVGTYELVFGPTDETEVRVVVEHAAHEEGT